MKNKIYHVTALSQDVSYPEGCLSGLANISFIKKEIEKSKKIGHNIPKLEDAVQKLEDFFYQEKNALSSVLDLIKSQEFDGELLNEVDGNKVKNCIKNIKTTISTKEAKKLAEFICDSYDL